MDEDIEILINEIDEFKKQLHFILTQTVAPALKEMIITVAKNVSEPLNKALKTYLSNTDLILNKTHIDLDFIKDCRYLAVGINDHCDVSTAPPTKSINIENQYNNCTINNYYTDQSKDSFDWKFWIQIVIDIIAIALPIFLGVL